MRIVLVALFALAMGFVGYSFYVSQPVVEGTRGDFRPEIAEPADALTFARASQGLVLVTQHDGEHFLYQIISVV